MTCRFLLLETLHSVCVGSGSGENQIAKYVKCEVIQQMIRWKTLSKAVVGLAELQFWRCPIDWT
jgi:hypothetical protein